jgi:hypothetical protein
MSIVIQLGEYLYIYRASLNLQRCNFFVLQFNVLPPKKLSFELSVDLQRGARYLTGENLKVVPAKFSTLSCTVLLIGNKSEEDKSMQTAKVEISTEAFSR